MQRKEKKEGSLKGSNTIWYFYNEILTQMGPRIASGERSSRQSLKSTLFSMDAKLKWRSKRKTLTHSNLDIKSELWRVESKEKC